MHETPAAQFDASPLQIAIVASRYHREITDALVRGASEAFGDAGGSPASLTVIDAPGAWELTAICRALAAAESPAASRPDAIVAIGCILTGQTTHDQYIAQSVTQGLTAITVNTGVPIAFGVLTCQSIDQARARAGFAGGPNKGAEAMHAAIAAASTIRRAMSAGKGPR